MNTAERDIAFQAPVELKIASELAKKKKALMQHNGKGSDVEKDFVLWVPERVEVKCDYMAKKTRNAYFEVHNSYRNKPSGLTATTANWWAHYVPGDALCYVFSPARMLSWLLTESGLTKLTGCGDKNSDGFLVPLKILAGLKFVKSMEVML